MDDAVSKIGGGSCEHIAYKLMLKIAASEGKVFASNGDGETADREWIFRTYTECLKTAKGFYRLPGAAVPSFGSGAAA